MKKYDPTDIEGEFRGRRALRPLYVGKKPLHSLELPEKPIPKGEIEGIELEKFIANLDPKLMVAQIKRECSDRMIRDWLVKTFPSDRPSWKESGMWIGKISSRLIHISG